MNNITFLKFVDEYVLFDVDNIKDTSNIKIVAVKINNGKIIAKFRSLIKTKNDKQNEPAKFLNFINNLTIISTSYSIFQAKQLLNIEITNDFIDWLSLQSVLMQSGYNGDIEIPNEWVELSSASLFIGLSQYEEIKKYVRDNNIDLSKEITKYNQKTVNEQLAVLSDLGFNYIKDYKAVNEYVIVNVDFQIQNEIYNIYGLYAFKIKDEKIFDIYYKLLKPTNKLTKMAQELTGFTNEMLESHPTFEQVKNEFFEFINNQIVVEYNFPIITLLNHLGLDIKNIVSIDIIIKQLFKNNYIVTESMAKLLNLTSYNMLYNFKALGSIDLCLFIFEAFEKIKQHEPML